MPTQLFFVSTTIPYVNSKPHVGFALELAQADTYARYLRLRGDRASLQSGTDENSLKNVLAARDRGIPVQSHVDENAGRFQELIRGLDFKFDHFVRTTSPEHRASVEIFWRLLKPEDLYTHRYSGWYCIGCEDFVQDDKCPEHPAPPVWLDEENIFFRLSRYQEALRELISSDRLKITPAFRKKEILNFIEAGLTDISITRDRARSGDRGLSVPGRSDQVIYVWIDALINYLTGTGGGSWNGFTRRIHFLGKNVWKFHAVYWPALLLSAGLKLPDEIVIHGFLTIDGKKISKSAGATIDPIELIGRFGADTLRFYLLRAVSPFDDGDFSTEKLVEVHNSFLVNGIGNLLSRLQALACRAGLRSSALRLEPRTFAAVDRALNDYRFDEALKELWQEFDRINSQISREKPWEILKNAPELARRQIQNWLEDLWALNDWLGVFLPHTAQKIDVQLREIEVNRGHLFTRIDDRSKITC